MVLLVVGYLTIGLVWVFWIEGFTPEQTGMAERICVTLFWPCLVVGMLGQLVWAWRKRR